MTLHDYLADKSEDPGTTTCRNANLDELLDSVSDNQDKTVRLTAESYNGREIASELAVSRPRGVQLKHGLKEHITEEWGDDMLAEVSKPPEWAKNIRAVREKKPYRHDEKI